MTKSMILAHINAANPNKSIKWYIVDKTDDQIVLTNDYDACVKFTITIGAEGIIVTDDHMTQGIAYLVKGTTRWDDFIDDEDGILMALKATVNYFNRTY